MLILFSLIICTVHFCEGKALLEEIESNKGKRPYDFPNSGLHQTYDPQSNAEHWMKGKFYEPQVDGQPIYLPAVDQPGSYNEFLDAYYKAYTPAWTLPTVPYTYDTKNTKTATKDTSDKKDSFKYTLPTSKKSEFSVDMSTDSDFPQSEEHDGSEDVDKITTKLSKVKPETLGELEEILTESFKKPQLPKTKPKDNKYNKPVVVKTKQKSKTNNSKDVNNSSSDIDGIKYASKISKESLLSGEMSTNDYDESPDYDGPNIVDKTRATELNNENAISELEDKAKFEEPVIRESLNIPELKKKPEDHNQYGMPVVKTVQQKPKKSNAKNVVHKKPSTPKSIYKSTKKTVIKDGNKYVSPVSKESEFSVEMSTSDLEYEDYDDPEVDKTIEAELNREKLDMTSELNDKEFEEPVVRESLKSELKKPQDHDQYDMPVVVKTKQKPKTNNAEKDHLKNPSAPKNMYKSTEKTISKGSDKNVEYESPASKQSEFSVEMNASDYDLESEDYDAPKIINKIVLNEFNNEKLDMKSEFANDEIEEPVLRESQKSELSKTESKGNSQYDMPVVENKQKYANIKTTQENPNTQTKPKLESDYEQTQTVKANQNKISIETASEQKYGDKTIKGIRKKSKGKRRKQYSKLNSRTGEAVEHDILDSTTINEEPDELSNTPIKVREKVKNKTKETIKTKEKVACKQDSQYDSVTKVKAKSNSKETMANKKSKPVTVKEKIVVQTDTQYQPIKNKEKVNIKSDSISKPVKENVKYETSGFVEEDLTKLNIQDKDFPESEINIGNTDNPLEDKLDLGSSLDMSEEFSEKLNSESTMIDSDINLSSNSDVLMKPESIVPNTYDLRGLTSMNSNIWSMLFNPNAEKNKLKLKRCVTRSNETGFCTYIQNCEVPRIATSLEQLLNSACVIDDIFIGVCCPEFPVQTVKVQWDQTSDFDNTVEDEFGHIAEDCGIRSNEALELQSWPWKAPLVSMSNGKIFCGGVIVSEDHVLTAAHCTTKIPKNQILVRLGQYDDESGDDYVVVEIKRHAQYNPRTMQNDIALLKLGRRIMNDAHIGIVCLPDEESNNHNEEIATLLGWRGIFATKSRDPEFLRVISNKECEKKLGMKVASTTLCTETRKESERTCNADSGAPLVIEDDGQYEVIGILSWNRNDCDQRFPSTFSRVSSYTGWIKNHIG